MMKINKERVKIGKTISKLGNYILPAEMRGYQKTSFSRSGEDLILLEIFKKIGVKGAGIYVDIGANHPFRCSNTAIFDSLGWMGVCVDPHPEMVELQKIYRPQTKVVHSAVSLNNEDYINLHYIEGHPALASLNRNNVLESKKALGINGVIKSVQVKNTSLTKILDTLDIPSNFDLLDIDCERNDLDVIKSLDLCKYTPRVILIEVTINSREISEILAENRYNEIASISLNKIYSKDNV